MGPIRILWADDEIDFLKMQILFLEEKGYEVVTTTNGSDAVDLVRNQNFDIVFLDENMPGLSGLQTLTEIKRIYPAMPIIMITKSEEEEIMDEAIGSKTTDYLIKPVNPNQLLLSIKKIMERNKLVSKKTTSAYQTEFGKLGMLINLARNFDDWCEIYRNIVFWDVELSKYNNAGMEEVLKTQKNEANNEFAKYIKNNYQSWFDKNSTYRPLLSQNIFKDAIFPLLDQGQKVFMILIDNFRYDQWRTLMPIISEFYNIERDDLYCSILPTATQYARNAIFAGLMPSEIDKIYPDLWLNDEEEGGKNMHEEEMLANQLKRHGKQQKFYYEKIINYKEGSKIQSQLPNVLVNQLSVIVYNFIDMLSHARTEMDMIRELASDEAAYRSLTSSWFKHSPILQLFKDLANYPIKLVLTTDHGSIRVDNPVKVIGDRQTSTNLRYKQGKNLNYNPKEVFAINNPAKVHLPVSHVSSSYIFSVKNDFFAYPNNYNYYVKYYKGTFQHGGISMEEMLIPLIVLSPKG